MNIRSAHKLAGTASPVRYVRAASRCVVEHPTLTTLLVVLLVATLCAGQWWLSYEHAKDWDRHHPGQPTPFRLFDRVGWTLMFGAGVWFGLWRVSGKESARPPTSGTTDWWRFDQRERQRIFEGRLVDGKLLWIHGLFGLVGFAFGVGTALKLVAAVAWQVEILSDGRGPLGLVLLVTFVMVFAARRIRDVLFLQHCDYFVGDRAQELALAVAEEEQAEAEAEREYERKTITGLPYVVFMGGFIGGLFLSAKLLPETEGTMAFSGSISGLIASVAVLYQRRMKPRRGIFWMTVALTVSVAFLVFTCVAWQRPVQYALLGVLWGAIVGVAATLLYLRKLPNG